MWEDRGAGNRFRAARGGPAPGARIRGAAEAGLEIKVTSYSDSIQKFTA